MMKMSVWLMICAYWSVFAIIIVNCNYNQYQSSITNSTQHHNDVEDDEMEMRRFFADFDPENSDDAMSDGIIANNLNESDDTNASMDDNGLEIIGDNNMSDQAFIDDLSSIDDDEMFDNIGDQSQSSIIRPSESSHLHRFDIVLGRGGYWNHEGNKMFRGIVEKYYERYVRNHNTNRKKRNRIARKMIKSLETRGFRFVKLDKNTNRWIVIEDEKLKIVKIMNLFNYLKAFGAKEEVTTNTKPILHHNDILCGRGGSVLTHSGNNVYRTIVAGLYDKYRNAKHGGKQRIAMKALRETKMNNLTFVYLDEKKRRIELDNESIILNKILDSFRYLNRQHRESHTVNSDSSVAEMRKRKRKDVYESAPFSRHRCNESDAPLPSSHSPDAENEMRQFLCDIDWES
jgi:hypothetical protein